MIRFPNRLFFTCATVLVCALGSCTKPGTGQKKRPSLKKLVGRKYVEYRREFDNGKSFNYFGFQLEPEWVMHFLSEDSVEIYSPSRRKYLHYKIYFDHDSVFNMAREWLRIKTISEDSLAFQLLQVQDRAISRERSNVYMRFYSESYIRTRLKVDPELLKRPSKADTGYIRGLAAKANRNPGNIDSSFAARQPVEFVSRTSAINVSRTSGTGDYIKRSRADVYLYPEYYISIRGAYKDFDYSFSVLVDDKGEIRLGNFLTSEEFRASRRKVLEGIIKVYLQRYLIVKPGTTLGIPHTSELTIHLKGRQKD